MPHEKKPLILVIDDENGIRTYLKMMLKNKGFDVIEATNGVEGFDKVVHEHPVLVITDVAMIGLNGLEIFRRMRAHEEVKDTPILFSTALTLPENIPISRETRTDYINKPFEFDELFTKVVELLNP